MGRDTLFSVSVCVFCLDGVLMDAAAAAAACDCWLLLCLSDALLPPAASPRHLWMPVCCVPLSDVVDLLKFNFLNV